MPYNVDKKLGGDNEENMNFMEKCVDSIHGNNKRTGKPYTKGEKIAICKTSLKNKKSSIDLEENLVDNKAVELVESTIEQAIRKMINQNLCSTQESAMSTIEGILNRSNNDIEVFKYIIDNNLHYISTN